MRASPRRRRGRGSPPARRAQRAPRSRRSARWAGVLGWARRWPLRFGRERCKRGRAQAKERTLARKWAMRWARSRAHHRLPATAAGQTRRPARTAADIDGARHHFPITEIRWTGSMYAAWARGMPRGGETAIHGRLFFEKCPRSKTVRMVLRGHLTGQLRGQLKPSDPPAARAPHASRTGSPFRKHHSAPHTPHPAPRSIPVRRPQSHSQQRISFGKNAMDGAGYSMRRTFAPRAAREPAKST